MKKPHRPQAGRSSAEARSEAASALAVTALSFLATEPERLAGFLTTTGLGPQSLRAAAREPGFLLGVLEYISNDENLLLAFAEASGFDPQDIARAREVLGDRPGHTGAA
jgi:hypothetical protein